MVNITASRRIHFCAGHRVHQHESKCNNPHGHNYVIFFDARAKGLDNIGRVIDFSKLKEVLGGWVDKFWDHGFIYYKHDKEMRDIFINSDNKSYAMDENPTAENMGKHLIEDICPTLMNEYGIEIHRIEIWETENCKVEVTLED